MLNIFQAHDTFLSSCRVAMPADGFKSVAAGHVTQIKNALLKMSAPALEDAAKCMTAIHNSINFTADDKSILVGAITQLTAAEGGASAPDSQAAGRPQRRPQTHMYVHNYCTASDWNQLMDAARPLSAKTDVLLFRAHQIGLVTLCEKTAVYLTAFVLFCHQQAYTKQDGYQHLQSMKAAFKQQRAHATWTSLQLFPRDVKEFMALYTSVYTSEIPVEPRINVEKLQVHVAGLPCRKTHTCIRSEVAASTATQVGSFLASVPNAPNLAQALVQLLSTQGRGGPPRTPPAARRLSSTDSLAVDNTPTPASESPLAALCDVSPEGTLKPLISASAEALTRSTDLTASASSTATPTAPASASTTTPRAASVSCSATPPTSAAVHSSTTTRSTVEPASLSGVLASVQEALQEKRASTRARDKSKDTKAKAKKQKHETAQAQPCPRAKAKAPAKAKARPAPAATAKAVNKMTLKKTAEVGSKKVVAPKMPSGTGSAEPLTYGSCSIYTSGVTKSFRCVEARNRRFDKRFEWKDDKAQAWQRALKWCKDAMA
jgi:hypothetical protein